MSDLEVNDTSKLLVNNQQKREAAAREAAARESQINKRNRYVDYYYDSDGAVCFTVFCLIVFFGLVIWLVVLAASPPERHHDRAVGDLVIVESTNVLESLIENVINIVIDEVGGNTTAANSLTVVGLLSVGSENVKNNLTVIDTILTTDLVVNGNAIFADSILIGNVLLSDAPGTLKIDGNGNITGNLTVLGTTRLKKLFVDELAIGSVVTNLINGTNGKDGTNGRDGRDGFNSTVPGPPGRDGLNSTVPGPQGPPGFNGTNGLNSTIPGPQGPIGPQGPPGPAVNGTNGKDSTVPGPPGTNGTVFLPSIVLANNSVLVTNGSGTAFFSQLVPYQVQFDPRSFDHGANANANTYLNGAGRYTIPTAGIPPTAVTDQILLSTSVAGTEQWLPTAANSVLVTGPTGIQAYVQYTGSGAPVLANSPTLINPNLGDATANSLILVNPLAVLQGGTGVTCSTGTGCVVLSNSPILTTPILGAASATSLTLSTPLAVLQGGTGTGTATGSGFVVLQTSPTLITPNLGVATATSLTVSSQFIAAGGTSWPTTTGTTGQLLTLSAPGNLIWTSPIASLTNPLPVLLGGTGVNCSTGTGCVVLSNSPTLITPNLGAASASSLTISGQLNAGGTNWPTVTGTTGQYLSLASPGNLVFTTPSASANTPLPVLMGGTGTNCSTGTGCNVLSKTPTITTPNIIGDVTGVNSAAGSVGEFVTATSTPTVGVVTLTTYNAVSISLTAGHWRIYGNAFLDQTGGTTWNYVVTGISTVSTPTIPTPPNNGAYTTCSGISGGGSAFTTSCFVGNTEVTITTTTTFYLSLRVSFNSGSASYWGFIGARRVL